MASPRGIEQRLRMRELAGDARAGSWARARARTTQRKFIRDAWLVLSLFMLAVLAAGVLTSHFMPTEFLKGLVIGATLIAGSMALWMVIVQVTGTAPVMMGDHAEQWTAQELRQLGRSWLVVNHLSLSADDIDHVLIGPGGVYAVETKWCSEWASRFGVERQRIAVMQASRNAGRLRLWQPLKSRDIPVRPLVVLWGPGLSRWPASEKVRIIDEVPVVVGTAVRDWTQALPGDGLDAGQIEAAWDAFDAHVARRDPVETVNHPLPTSMLELVLRLTFAILLAGLGLVWLGQLYAWTGSNVATIASAITSMLPALMLRRFASVRWAMWGWITGVSVPAIALALTAVTAT